MATDRLSHPGGSQTYSLTLAEHLSRLGHGVTLYAPELGAMAQLARERALHVVGFEQELPAQVDGVIVGIDRSLAFALAARYPQAARVFVVHGADEIHLPPPVPGVVTATIALNDMLCERSAASPGAGEVVRLHQPVDLRRFCGRGDLPPRPRRVLLLGNYHAGPGQRSDMLREAWGHAGLQWRQLGGGTAVTDPAGAIADADVVVGYGRSILEALASGKAAYVHDHAGTGGWVTHESYPELEAGGFALRAAHAPASLPQLRADLDAYAPELGTVGKDLARRHHDARTHAAQVIAVIGRQARTGVSEPSTLRAMAQLSEAILRAELAADRYLGESRQWFELANELQDRLAEEHVARHTAEQAAADAGWQLEQFRRTRRYRLARALAAPVDRVRRRRR